MDSFTSSGRRARHRDRLTNACFLYVIKIGSSRSLYIGIETHVPLPEAHQTTLLGAREGPDKRPSGASSAGPFETKEASSKCMKHGDGRAVIVVHEHDSHGSAVAKCFVERCWIPGRCWIPERCWIPGRYAARCALNVVPHPWQRDALPPCGARKSHWRGVGGVCC